MMTVAKILSLVIIHNNIYNTLLHVPLSIAGDPFTTTGTQHNLLLPVLLSPQL